LGKEVSEFQRLDQEASAELGKAIKELSIEEGDKTREVYMKHADALYAPYAKFR